MNKAAVNLLNLKLQLVHVNVKNITAKQDQTLTHLYEKTTKDRLRAQF